LPDACIVLDFMLHEMIDILGRLTVHTDRMIANLDSTKGLIFSQPVLLALVDAGMDRHEAYRIVQAHAHRTHNGGPNLLEALSADPAITPKVDRGTLERLFDPRSQLRHVEAIFARLGLVGGGEHGNGASPTSDPRLTQHIPKAAIKTTDIDAPLPQT
jgi:adenylosuccinate lyase